MVMPASFGGWSCADAEPIKASARAEARTSRMRNYSFECVVYTLLQPFQTRGGVAEAVELDPHAVHDRQIQTAHLAVFVAGFQIIARAPGLQRDSQNSGHETRQAGVVVQAADPQLIEKHQAGVVEHRTVSLRHAV